MDTLLLLCKGFMESVIKYFLEIAKYMNNWLDEYIWHVIFAIFLEVQEKVPEVKIFSGYWENVKQ